MTDIQKELAIRLAWYADRYGEIPEKDLIKLWRAATLGKGDEETERITSMAEEIIDYFQSL